MVASPPDAWPPGRTVRGSPAFAIVPWLKFIPPGWQSREPRTLWNALNVIEKEALVVAAAGWPWGLGLCVRMCFPYYSLYTDSVYGWKIMIHSRPILIIIVKATTDEAVPCSCLARPH